MSTDVIVQTHNLSKTFDIGNALSEANMRVDKGTIYGFLGANGAEKTTMFKLFTSLLKPTNGIATVCGLNVADNRTEIIVFTIFFLTETAMPMVNDTITKAIMQIPWRWGIYVVPGLEIKDFQSKYSRTDLRRSISAEGWNGCRG